MVERNVGEVNHSWMLGEMMFHLAQYEATLGLLTAPTWRVRLSADRVRVPDVTVVRGEPGEKILTRPPFLFVEILSPEDSESGTQERVDDYLAFGAENIWIVDPWRRKAFWADSGGIHEAADGVLHAVGQPVSIDLAGLWPTV